MDHPESFSSEKMFRWIQEQVGMGARRPGSAAGARNEDFLESRLRGFGLEQVRREPIPITHWAAQEAHLFVGQEGSLEPVECFPIPYTAFTDGTEAPLVYADPKALRHRESWDGAIVVTEIGFPPLDVNLLTKISMGQYDPQNDIREAGHPATWVRLGWHIYRLAAERGAVGFIGIVKDQPGGTCRMYAPYGFREKNILDKPIPGMWIGKKQGPRLVTLARSGSGRARLRLTGIAEPGVTHNIVGEIPGRSDEEVTVLSCHHDSPFASPVEDASGVAVVLALAEHFARERGLQRRLVVLFTAGHFYGSIGTRSFIRLHREDIVRRTALEITIEHIAHEAVENEEGVLVKSGRPEAAGVFVPFNSRIVDAVLQSLKDCGLNRAVLLPPEGPLGNYPPTDGGDWYEAGVPLINYICNPVYLLTDDDNFAWVDKNRLANVAGVFARILREMDKIPKREIRSIDKPIYRLFMKLLRLVVYAKTTRFGRHPVY